MSLDLYRMVQNLLGVLPPELHIIYAIITFMFAVVIVFLIGSPIMLASSFIGGRR